MATPSFLLIEMRLAFKSCARQHTKSSLRCFSNTSRYRQDAPRRGPPAPSKDKALKSQTLSRAAEVNTDNRQTAQDKTGLATREPQNQSLDTNRRVPVPMKVIPKAQLAPGVHLSPRQRLHVEMLTRRPNVGTEKKIFRERIQIYHIGSFKENLLNILKVSSIVAVCAVSFVFVPAHINAGTAGWIVALLWLGGLVPGLATHYMFKSWVNRVFLDLPDKARESPQAAMEYAKNLPSDAMLDIRYLKLWGLEGNVKGFTSEFVPTRGGFLKPLTFRWSDRVMQKHNSSFWVPTSFYVQPETAAGSRSINTVPGLWKSVYQQLIRDPTKKSTKWQSKLESNET